MVSDVKHTIFRRRRDQRFVLSYVPKGGSWARPRQVTAPKEVTSVGRARAWAAGEIAKIRKGGGVHPARKRAGGESLRDVHERLMAVRESHPDTKQATLKNNWTHLREQILGVGKRKTPADPIADLPMADVDVSVARAFVRRVRARVSANHTRNVVSTASTLWDVAQGENIIRTANPFKNDLVAAELPKQRNVNGLEPLIVPPVAAQALLDAVDVITVRNRARYALALCSGLDDGEIAGLTWGDVVMVGLEHAPPHVHVRQAFALRARDGARGLQSPKTENRLRRVPLHPAALAALEEWLGSWESLVCRHPRADDFVFVKSDGGAYRPKSAENLREDLREINRAHVAAGGQPVLGDPAVNLLTFKSCRRSFSSALKDADVDKEDRGKLMGHSGASVTERNYTRFELTRLATLVSRIPLRWPTGLCGRLWPQANGCHSVHLPGSTAPSTIPG